MLLSLKQTSAIFKKNLRRNLANKKALLSQFVFPIMVSLIYYFYKCKFKSIQQGSQTK